MIDRLFSATLVFSLLAAGTLAIGSELLGLNDPTAAPALNVVHLPTVVVTGKRVAPATTLATSEPTEPAARRVE